MAADVAYFIKPPAVRALVVFHYVLVKEPLDSLFYILAGIADFFFLAGKFFDQGFFKSILDMAFTAYSMVGAGITPALLAAFLWKRVTAAGGVASMIAGLAVPVLITLANFALPEPLMETEYIVLPAVAASVACLVGVSLLTAPSPAEKWQPFRQAR